ncbi:MAG: hypothetical protein J5829_00715 [Lachnospiraceae bacterium]|nr:hypothetical protein [Lachnospiraceae bacterium]
MPAFVSFIIAWICSFALVFLSEVSLLEHSISDVLCRDMLISWIIALLFAIGVSVKGNTAFQLLPEDSLKNDPADVEYKQYPGGPANHFNGQTSDCGHLYLFPDSLVFHPYSPKTHRPDFTIKYSNIEKIKPSSLNSIIIITKDEKKHRFAVENKQQWVSDISSKTGGTVNG